MTSKDVVERFFGQHKLVGLQLPAGWFDGRPMDTFFQPTFWVSLPKRLIIELDSQLLLVASGTVEVRTERVAGPVEHNFLPCLSITGFSQLWIDFLEYGSDKPSLETASSGELRIVGID